MKTYFIPALITLSAGAVYCLVSILNHYTLREMLLELLIVLIIFYVIGSLIRIIFDRNFPIITEKDEENPEGEEGDGELTVEEIQEGEGTEQMAENADESKESMAS